MKRLVIWLLLLSLLLCGCQEQTKFFVTLNLVEYTVDTQTRTISDGTHCYSYSALNYRVGDHYKETVTTIRYPDGGEYEHTREDNRGTVTEEGKWITETALSRCAAPEDLIRVWNKVKVEEQKTVRIDWWPVILGAVLAGLGVLHVVFPDFWIHLRLMWYVDDPEPTDWAIFMTRLGGWIYIVAGIIIVTTAF